MALHAWWTGFGEPVETNDRFSSAAAREFAAFAGRGDWPGVQIAGLRLGAEYEAILLDVETERPQELAHPIRACEPVAVLFPVAGGQPRILAVRDDFPDTPHQNWTPQGAPCSLCVDDRPWTEARVTYTPADLVRRIQLWLAKAARGELHDAAQPPEPLFFKNPLSFVIASAALADNGEPAELIGLIPPDNPAMVLARPAAKAGSGGEPGRFVVLPFQAPPQSMRRMRHAPETLAALAQECTPALDLLETIRARIAGWAGLEDDNLRRLSARLAIVVAFPVQGEGNGIHHDLRGFVTHDTAGDVGVALGVVARNESGTGAKAGYVKLIGAKPASKGEEVRIEPIEVHFAFDRGIGAAVAGNAPDTRRAVLVGAGAIGSQVSLTLAREGALSWSVVDQDILLPHNFARHALFPRDTGVPKAAALARQLSALTGEPVYATRADITDPPAGLKADIDARLAEADIVIDASASVAVARHLSDLTAVKARRFSVFFNPAGTAVVLLAEAADRAITLRDLEAQYHRLHLSVPGLAGHLKLDVPGLHYSGSCRSATNRIPASRASLLSAIAARGISAALKEDSATIRIWTVGDEGEVKLIKGDAAAVTRHRLGDWDVTYDEEVLRALSAYRAESLPNETGGVLLGITDSSRCSIHVAHVMGPPEDSRGSVTGFERGVAGLSDAVTEAAQASMHQLRYVGEWHSHPRGVSPMPSTFDLGQLAWLSAELRSEGLPALMAIAADRNSFAFAFADTAAAADGRRASA
jgi:E2/UBC family protein A/ThiF family protein/JAB domain-containing protein similar to deubiquitination enzymes